MESKTSKAKEQQNFINEKRKGAWILASRLVFCYVHVYVMLRSPFVASIYAKLLCAFAKCFVSFAIMEQRTGGSGQFVQPPPGLSLVHRDAQNTSAPRTRVPVPLVGRCTKVVQPEAPPGNGRREFPCTRAPTISEEEKAAVMEKLWRSRAFLVTGEQAEEIYELMLLLSVQCTDLLAKSRFRKEPLRIDLTPIIYLTTAIKKHVEDLKWPGV